MRSLRSHVVSLVARRYLRRRGGKAFDLGHLPPAVLMPLRRDGLDPVPELRQDEQRPPISQLATAFGLRIWLVTGHAEAKAVLADAESFSTDFAHMIAGVPGAAVSPGGLGFADPPVHTRLRRILTPEFTMRRLARLEPRIRGIVDDCLDAIDPTGPPADLVPTFALPIPSLVICELLGVPYADRDEFAHHAMNRFDSQGGVAQMFGAMSESLVYLREVVRQQRRNPGEGLLGGIIRDHGDEIDDEELAGLADGVLTGGFETTASMLALGALVLIGDPSAARMAAGDADEVNKLVEELLRHLAVVQMAFPRFARKDIEIDGVRIEKGDSVLVSLSGANRDPMLGPGLDVITPDRHPVSHLAFGHGFHRCVGAELARMELRAAYPALIRRFPDIRLAVPADQLQFRKVSVVYGLEQLPVLLTAPAAVAA